MFFFWIRVFYIDVWCEHLQQIDALDHFEDLTEIGYHLADLPLEPRLGKVVLYSIVLKCLDPVLTIVCALAYKDPCKFYWYSLPILVDFVVDLQNQMLIIKVRYIILQQQMIFTFVMNIAHKFSSPNWEFYKDK